MSAEQLPAYNTRGQMRKTPLQYNKDATEEGQNQTSIIVSLYRIRYRLLYVLQNHIVLIQLIQNKINMESTIFACLFV